MTENKIECCRPGYASPQEAMKADGYVRCVLPGRYGTVCSRLALKATARFIAMRSRLRASHLRLGGVRILKCLVLLALGDQIFEPILPKLSQFRCIAH